MYMYIFLSVKMNKSIHGKYCTQTILKTILRIYSNEKWKNYWKKWNMITFKHRLMMLVNCRPADRHL